MIPKREQTAERVATQRGPTRSKDEQSFGHARETGRP